MSIFLPIVTQQTIDGYKSSDIYSKLLQDRIVFLTDEITDDMANLIIAQLLFLESDNKHKPISLYVNSPGGSVTAGLAIYDTMKLIKPKVSTICIGSAASMASFIVSSGAKGRRYALPNAELMIHQVSGGAVGQESDIQIVAKHIEKTKQRLNKLLSKNTGKSIKQIIKDCDRDYYMSAEEAVNYGLIDKVLIPCK